MRILLSIFILIFSCVAFAFERSVRLDWEPIDDADSYEISIGFKNQEVSFRSQADLRVASWSGVLSPGSYWMRVRGLDDRKVPGEWSDKIQFDVKLTAPFPLSPLAGSTLSTEGDESEVQFKWTPVPGAQQYQLTVLDNSQKPVLEQKVRATEVALKFPTSAKYLWFVQAVDQNGQLGEKIQDLTEVTLQGPPLVEPKIKKPETAFVRRVDFELAPNVEKLKVKVKRWDEATRAWVSVHEQELEGKKSILFRKEWRGGKYQITAQSLSGLRAPSSVSEATFPVVDGVRTQSAESRALVRKSIDRVNGWFMTASYVASMVQYTGISIEENKNLSLNAMTGTGLIGFGRFWEDSPYGFLGSLDYGGIIVDGKNTTFMGLELAGLYKQRLSRNMDLRYRLGIFQKETPEVTSTEPVKVSRAKQLGPVLGVELWHALTPKWGWQTSLTARQTISGSSEAGGTVKASLSYQAGLMGSYRFSEQSTGLVGYNYKVDKSSRSTRNENLALDGVSEATLTGHYLNFIMEYGF